MISKAPIGVGKADQVETVDADDAGSKLDRLTGTGEIIGPLAIHLDGGELRRHL